ncbi:MAG: tRNA (N6-isopentenyl adenosine(37)-C2)-methylthiotransferase MiaB [Planctomycetia bacterium]|nr:tRNA (N6-isopentenyl adenosine(37)-C2)-methylthiotransferase MiaB [Planctomycetia bacterium]
MNQKKFYLETVGCQMNVLDSELIVAELLHRGLQQTFTKKNADIILFNTCSVRSHAEEKIYSALGRLKHWKEIKPNGILGVLGCMAQKDQQLIFRRAPHVDLILGPGQLDKLPELIQTIETQHIPQMAVSLNRFRGDHQAVEIKESFRQYDPKRIPQARQSSFQAMVRIMFGCNKFCTYCIVPGVRGPEQSRPANEIVTEIQKLADQGCVDLTLLGQTVNSYKYQEGERTVRLPELLEKIDNINGIRRVRFVSNYPVGMTNELLQAVRDLPSVIPYIHVPAQHGADAVLKRMKRMYSVTEYKELIQRIYATIPDVAITSDFIVGFCGETEEEFQQTIDLVRYARFKNSFIFKYSVREGTKASLMFEDDIPDEIKKRRNNELLAVQNEISAEWNRCFIGKEVEILVEGPSKNQMKTLNPEKAQSEESAFLLDDEFPLDNITNKTLISQDGNETQIKKENQPVDAQGNLKIVSQKENNHFIQLTGRTPCDRIVVFNGSPELIGTFQTLKIESSAPFTLFGKMK